jgi:hypothetical protein
MKEDPPKKVEEEKKADEPLDPFFGKPHLPILS